MTGAVADFDLRSTLIPFVARVFWHGTARAHKPTQGPLPIGAWQRYTVEDFDELSEILSEGVVRALALEAGGWQGMEVLRGDEPRDARGETARFWDVTNDLTLEFTDSSLRLCEALHNIVLRPGDLDPEVQGARQLAAEVVEGLDFQASGDRLALLFMVSGLWKELGPRNRTRGSRPYIRAVLAAAAAKDPTLALRFGPALGTSVESDAVVALVEGPTRELSPWLVAYGLAEWRRLETRLWEGTPKAFLAARKAQAALAEVWADAISRSGWIHLATPFIATYAWLLDGLGGGDPDLRSERALDRLNDVFRDESQQSRFELRAAWASALESASAFADLHRKTARVHPADRESNQVWFLDWWTRTGAGEVVDDAQRIARTIEGRLG